jgi:hypothetical protein
MKDFLTIGILALVLLMSLQPSNGASEAANESHGYTLDFTGTAGVKVRLLLVTKATPDANPERREEIVTLPAKIEFTAVRCYAWIDTLPKGESGNEGDACNVELLKNGKIAARVEIAIKKQNKQSGGLGDL